MTETKRERLKEFARRMAPTYWGWAVVALLCYVVGFFLAGLAMFMVWKFGETFGVTEAERNAYGAMHAVLHVSGIATAFCIGGYLNEKRPWRAFVAMLIVMAVGAYGIQNIAGFAAKNRVATADAIETNNKNTWETYLTRQKTLQERIERTAEVIVDVRGYLPAERNEARRLKRDYEKQLAELKPPTVTAETVSGDASASVFARLTGWGFGTMQASAVVLFAILCFIVEVYIFVQGTDRAARAWGRGGEPASEPKKTHGSDGSPGSGGGEPKRKPDLKSVPKPEPQPARAEPSKQRRSWSYVPATGAPERLERLSAFDRAWAVADQNPFLSTRQIADRAKVSQSTGARVQRRLRGKADRIVRKYGNGEGFRPLAYN